MKLCLAALLLLATRAVSLAQLTPVEKRGVADTLMVGNMTVSDMEYERKPFLDKYRIPLIDLCIDKPLDAADAMMKFHEAGAVKSLASLIHVARSQGLNDPAELTIVNRPASPDHEFDKLPAQLRSPVRRVVNGVVDANLIIKKALGNLNKDELRYLIEALPLYANEDNSIKFGFSTRTDYDGKRILALIDRIDLRAIRAAGESLAKEVEAAQPELESAAKTVSAPLNLKLRLDGLLVDIGGVEDNLHDDKDAVVTIDLGGRDTYRGRHGAGIGYASVLIDLGGDDLFEVPDLSLGSAILGVGLGYDIGGHDVFRTKSLSLGCGLAGVGGFYREGGKDTYESVSLAQGFGEFGIGILADTAGDDRYDANYNAQGAARTGGVGWLVDSSGDDVYRAGGLILNSPLFEKVHYSNSQGYGSGYREDTGGTSGGIGLLTDLSGDDNYIGETYCQAASYWFSVGSLYDRDGNDTYSAYHYAQASAMHMTAGYLFDLAGDDSYTVKLGAGQSIGHDYGVSFFLDRSGMDIYASHDSRPATGNANGLAIFIDSAGDDRYFNAPAAGNPARSSGSLSIFCDLGGTDLYASGLADNQAASAETWGVAMDQPINIASSGASAGSGSDATPAAPIPGSIQMPSESEMETIYRKATQWGVGTAQKEVGENNAKLIGIGKPAFQWMVNHHLKTASRLEIRSFTAVMNGIGSEARVLLAPHVGADDIDEARNALSIAVDGGVKEAAQYLPVALQKSALRRSAARAAGALGSKESVPSLLPLTIDPDRLLALNATISLAALKDPSSVSTGEALLESGELPIRKAALDLLAAFPNEAFRIGKRLSGAATDREVRIGIELLGRVGTEEAISTVGRLLSHPSSSVRIGALIALNHRVPDNFRPAVAKLQSDVDPLVRAVAARTDVGR